MSDDKVVIDTNIIISARNGDEPDSPDCLRLLERIDDGSIHALLSVVTLAELRAGFSPAQLPALFTPFLSHLRSSPNVSICPIDEEIAVEAGALRQRVPITLPDALVVATTLQRGATCLVTNDERLLKLKGVVSTQRPGLVSRNFDRST